LEREHVSGINTIARKRNAACSSAIYLLLKKFCSAKEERHFSFSSGQAI
jgi:hypothetical protein